jgi:predicted lipid-binding transport protein (Tim44 family)
MLRNRLRFLLALGAVTAVFTMLAADLADAAPRISGGNRGTRTFTPPSSTKTAPTPRPLERTMTQPGNPGSNVARPHLQNSPAAGLMNRPGFMGGLFAGLLGAGLIGLLLGTGLTGGLGGLASFLGLILQVGLIVLIARLVFVWWQRRNQPATAMGPSLRDMPPSSSAYQYGGTGGLGSARATHPDEIGTTAADFAAFERLLGDIQTAYGAEDIGKMRSRMTPEMLSYFMEELNANASRGVINRISDVKLLQGDAAEAWREGSTEYCTVTMRYSLKDEMVDRASNQVHESSTYETTELWTFMRVSGGSWILSAIQQTD